MPGEQEALLGVAALVADGAPVNWAEAEARLRESGHGSLAPQLRLLASVAEVHRSEGSDWHGVTSTTRSQATSAAETRDIGLGPGDRWGDLILLERVGHGSFGTVYKAHDRNLDRTVALKLLRPRSSTDTELVSRVLREGRTLARVHHPNVVVVHGAGTHEDTLGLWMEFVRGETLRSALRRGGTLSAEEAAAVGIKLCQALAAVHTAGLVHGDIKAQNVMREAGGRIVLMDFGAVRPKAIVEAATAEGVTGTPLYMAPELLEGAQPSVASDIYALGVLLFHLVTKRYPVEAASMSGLVVAHAQHDRTLLRDVRPELADRFVDVVECALAADRSARFGSAGAMERALAGVVSASAVGAGAADADSETTKLAWRALGGLGVVLVLGFLGFVSSAAFNVFLQIPGTFGSLNPLDDLIWGVRGMIPVVFYWLQGVLIIGAVVGLWRLARSVATRAAPDLTARWSAAVAARVSRVTLDPSLVAWLSLVIAIAGWVILTWYFADIFATLSRLVDAGPGVQVDVRVLSPEAAAYHRLHAGLYTVLSLLIALAIWRLPRVDPSHPSWRPLRTVRIGLAIVFAVTLITIALPYRVLWHSRFERVNFGGQRAYVLGQTDSELLLYLPESPEATHVIVTRDDARIARDAVRRIESVFSRE